MLNSVSPAPQRCRTTASKYTAASRGGTVVPLARAGVQTMRALLLQNDLAGGREMPAALTSAGFGVERSATIEGALELCRFYPFDAIVIDLRPDMLGQQAVCRIRAAGVEAPVLFFAASSAPAARIKALSLGADDVVVGGLCENELVARMQALVRRSKGLARPVLRIGRLSMDLLAREVSVNGRVVDLSNKEYAMLEVMATRMGAAVRKDSFLHQLYGGLDEPSLKTVDVLVCRLRQRLKAVGAEGLIHTIRGHGYAMREPLAGDRPALADAA